MMPEAELIEAAENLRLMAHPLRLRLVEILEQGEYPVKDLAAFCASPPHQVCEQLRMMKAHGLLDSERRGRQVFYRIVSPRLPRLLDCVRRSCGLRRR